MKRLLLLTIAALLVAASASAQITMEPRSIEFNASPDHALVSPLNNQPVLSFYEMQVMQSVPQIGNGPFAGGASMFTVNLGKPTPDGANLIKLTVPQFLTMAANVKAVATLTAVGPGGISAPTALSGPFGRVGAPATPGVPTVKPTP